MSYNPLLSSLVDIFNGFTAFDFKGQTLFLRHFSIRDQNLINICFEKYKNIALNKGIESKDDIYKRLKLENEWTDNNDLEISELELYISNLNKSKSKLFLPSQKEAQEKLIQEEQFKLSSLIQKRNEIVGTCAEDYAQKMSNEEFLRFLIFKDETLKELKFSKEEFGELNSDELFEISNIYYEISKRFEELNIQKIVLQDFFNMYISSCENAYVFFGKFIHELSAYQMKLLLYGRIFHNIFQYHENIPIDIRKDPNAIFEFVESKKTSENFQSKYKEGATAVFGATKKDLDILDPNAQKISLSEEIKKSGGSLNMEQMIKLMGQ